MIARKNRALSPASQPGRSSVYNSLYNELRMLVYERALQRYFDDLDIREPSEIFRFIEVLLAGEEEKTGLMAML